MSVVEALIIVAAMTRVKVTLATTALAIIQMMIPKPMKILVTTQTAVIPIPVMIPITTQQ